MRNTFKAFLAVCFTLVLSAFAIAEPIEVGFDIKKAEYVDSFNINASIDLDALIFEMSVAKDNREIRTVQEARYNKIFTLIATGDTANPIQEVGWRNYS